MEDDAAKAVGNLQLYVGQDAGCQAAVHLMHDIFVTNETEAVLLVDAENAFNSKNRQVSLHNIKYRNYPNLVRSRFQISGSNY